MKKALLLTFLIALSAPGLLNAAVLYEAHDVTWQGGGSIPSITLSQPMTKTDTYYIQYTVSLTSTVPPVVPGQDPNNRNSAYPYVNMANSTNGGAAFLFYIGGGYNSDYLLTSGFTTSTWHTNQFTASNDSILASTGMVAQYSTPEYGEVKFQVNLKLDMATGTYDYGVAKLDASGKIVDEKVLSGLKLSKGNYWNNNNTFSTLNFQSSTSQMTAHFDSIIVSTGPIPIPEPGSFVLAGLGAALLGVSRRRRKA